MTVPNRLGVMLLTYNRLAYAERTLRSTLDNLVMHGIELQVHVASDGDTSEYIDRLREVAGGYKHVVAVTHSNSERAGYGANYNLALQTVHLSCDYVLPLEDDWELQRPFSVPRLISDMAELKLGCVRLGYVGFTQPLRTQFRFAGGSYWLEFDPDSEEPHVFAGHPRVETREWQREVGPWPEHLKPGETEFAVTYIPAARKRVGWPLDLVHPRGDLFHHIGAESSYVR